MATHSTIVHSTVVVVPDDGTSPVGTDEWNDGHTVPDAAITGPMLAGTAIDGKSIAPQAVASVTVMTQKGVAIGGVARILAPAAIANTETSLVNFTIPANYMVPGTTFRLKAWGRLTTGGTPGSSIFRCRIGTASLAGNIPVSLTIVNATSVTSGPFYLEAEVIVRTDGAVGSIIGEMIVGSQTAAPVAFSSKDTISVISATVAIDTTAQKIIELTYISGNAGSTATFEYATIEAVNAA